MKIIFSPEYSGHLFVKPESGSVMMDTTVVNTIGLVNLLELRLGLHYEEIPPCEREALYYQAMVEYCKQKPKNIFANSFQTSGLATARSVLSWRDELRMAGWNFEGSDISERLKALIDIEQIFHPKTCADLAERVQTIMEQMDLQSLDCSDTHLLMPIEQPLLRPFDNQLVESLKKHGATLEILPWATGDNNLATIRQRILQDTDGKVRLNPDDRSLTIFHFTEEKNAYEYLTYNNIGDVSVWINPDNSSMDSWQALRDLPLSGSNAEGVLPPLTQMLILGVGLFSLPLNINTLIEWLNLPRHPFGALFRQRLASTIAETGGYRNSKCQELINKYINGDFVYLNDDEKKKTEEEQQKIRKQDEKKRERFVQVFLPPMDSPAVISRDALKDFALELSAWSRQLAAQKEEDLVEQLSTVATMSGTFHTLLCADDQPTIDERTLNALLSAISIRNGFTKTIAEQGCRIVVDSPAKVISVSDTTVWMGLSDTGSRRADCQFLSRNEREKLSEKGLVKIWDEENESRYYQKQEYMPLLHTSGRLILVTCDRRDGEALPKHPFIILLEQQVENLADFIVYPSISTDAAQEENKITKAVLPPEVKFSNAENLRWPDHLSPTNLDTLINYPFDYLMQSLLEITDDPKAQIADVRRTQGNVAHAVIEALFAPRDEAAYSLPDEIKKRIDSEYDTAYQTAIEATGAILRLPENKLDEKALHDKLKDCINILQKTIADNRLKVTGCEKYLNGMMGFGLPEKKDKKPEEPARDLTGYIDMTLEDETGNPVVFDFKWTTNRGKYIDLLSQNRSIQLELYRHMLNKTTKKDTKRVGYFLMPDGILFSREDFTGENCQQITSSNVSNIVDQILNSVRFRKEQLDKGIVETGNGLADSLDYVKNTAEKNLFPLLVEDGAKIPNKYSDYTLFNPQE